MSDAYAELDRLFWLECPSCGRGGTEYNLTYNLSRMLREAGMPPWADMVGKTAAEAGPIWRRVHTELRANPDRYRAFNPANGWGSYEQAVRVIGALASDCEDHPDHIVGGGL